MKCELCTATIDEGDEREYQGKTLCEDCYIDVLSPLKTCDPWAVHSAKNLDRNTVGGASLTPLQTEILGILKETGGIEPVDLLERFGGKLTLPQLEREFASLRHLERARGEKRNGRVYLTVW